MYFYYVKDKNTQDNWSNPEWIFSIQAPSDFDQYKIKRLDGKIENAKKLFQEKPNDNYTWITLGNMYEFAHDYERAIYAYNKSSEIQPNDFIGKINVAIIYEQNIKDYGKAAEYYQKTLDVSPPSFQPYDDAAQFYWHRLNKPEEAEKIYLSALENLMSQQESLVALVSYYKEIGNTEKLKEYAAKLIANFPDNERYKEAYGEYIEGNN
jgi:tetratricopeptide (TPR) repeat protein